MYEKGGAGGGVLFLGIKKRLTGTAGELDLGSSAKPLYRDKSAM